MPETLESVLSSPLQWHIFQVLFWVPILDILACCLSSRPNGWSKWTDLRLVDWTSLNWTFNFSAAVTGVKSEVYCRFLSPLYIGERTSLNKDFTEIWPDNLGIWPTVRWTIDRPLTFLDSSANCMSKGLKFPVIVHPLRFLPRWLMWIGSRDTVRSTRDSCRTKCPNKRRKTPCLNHSQSLSAFDVFGQCPKCCTTVLERPSDFDHRLSADGPNLGGLNSRGVLCINAMSPFLHIQIAVTAVYKSYKNAWNNSDSNQCTRVSLPNWRFSRNRANQNHHFQVCKKNFYQFL